MNSLMRTPMTVGIAMFAAVAMTTASHARPDARKMSCHQTQALIDEQGAVVLTTGQYTYARFVAIDGYCYYPEVPHITYIATRDTPQCPVYHCKEPIRPFED